MRFADPRFLLVAAAAVAVLVVLFVALGRARRRALAQIGSLRLLPELTASLSLGRRRFKQGAIIGGVALVGIALARPQLGYRWEETHRRGVDIMFAIDTSKSMLTRDVKPNRLERAKLAVRSLVQKFPADRVGLVAFAGSAFVQTPLTLDHGIFDESVAALDTQTIPLGGTDLASAIDTADKALAGDAHKRVLVLITDGEDLGGEALSAAERAAKDDVVIYTLGVGTPKGELIPEIGPDGQTAFVHDEQGTLVTSRLDEALLGKIAHATGGDYRPLGDGGQGLESLYHDRLSKLPQSDLASRSVQVPLERYQWPLGLALLLLGLEPLVGERRRGRASSPAKGVSSRKLAVAAGLAALLVAPAALASPQAAQRAYQKGDFAAAEKEYQEAAAAAPGDPRLTFNVGTSAYRKGDFEAAGKAFESTLRTGDLGLQEQAYYNLGNASFRSGEATLAKKDIEATKGLWKRAISEYEGALRLRHDDADAQYNLDLVKKRLADLEKKQDDEKKQDQDKKPQDGKGAKDKPQAGQGGKDDKPQPGQGGKDDKPQAGQGGKDDKPQPGQGGKDDKPQAGQGGKDDKPQAGQGGKDDKPQAGQGGKDDKSGPGELSKADAEALLDSLRGELKVTSRPPPGAKQAAQSSEPRKDW